MLLRDQVLFDATAAKAKGLVYSLPSLHTAFAELTGRVLQQEGEVCPPFVRGWENVGAVCRVMTIDRVSVSHCISNLRSEEGEDKFVILGDVTPCGPNESILSTYIERELTKYTNKSNSTNREVKLNFAMRMLGQVDPKTKLYDVMRIVTFDLNIAVPSKATASFSARLSNV